MSDNWINNLGTINKSKKGSLYIKIDKDVTLKAGDYLTLKKKSEQLDEALAAGRLNEQKYTELKESLSFIKYEIHKPPRKEGE